LKSKALIFILFIVAAALLIIFSTKNTDTPDTQSKPKPMKMRPQNPHAQSETVLPEVESIKLLVKDVSGEVLPALELKPNETKSLPGTDYQLRFAEFYTHWNWEGRPLNRTYHEHNPAVKVEVLVQDQMMYYMWAFKNMPFFEMKQHASPDSSAQKRLLFTLESYDGLKIPQASPQAKASPHAQETPHAGESPHDHESHDEKEESPHGGTSH